MPLNKLHNLDDLVTKYDIGVIQMNLESSDQAHQGLASNEILYTLSLYDFLT